MGGDHLWDAIAAIGQSGQRAGIGHCDRASTPREARSAPLGGPTRAQALGELYRTRATDDRLMAMRVKAESALGSSLVPGGLSLR